MTYAGCLIRRFMRCKQVRWVVAIACSLTALLVAAHKTSASGNMIAVHFPDRIAYAAQVPGSALMLHHPD